MNNNDFDLKKLPLYDGITHINIYSKAETELGRLLSNLSNLSVKIPSIGTFKCLEGYWYYLKCEQVLSYKEFEKIKDNFFDFNGFQAKKYGKEILENFFKEKKLITDNEIPNEFKDKIKLALQYKIKQNIYLAKLLVNSDLPFYHYYYYGQKDNAKVIFLNQYDWIIDEIVRLRSILKDVQKMKK